MDFLSYGNQAAFPTDDPGSVYLFDDQKPEEFWVTYVSQWWVHLSSVKDDEPMGPMTYEEFMAAQETRHWVYVDNDIDWCPICEERQLPEDDYLCRRCRYGVDDEDEADA
jgi:hypothetical protein